MGVDHSAFACYGAQIRLNDGVDIDDLDGWLAKTGLGYLEWGSRCYGGDGGFLVVAKGSTAVVDEGDDGCERLPDVDPVRARGLRAEIDAVIARGAPFTVTSDVAWWVGGVTRGDRPPHRQVKRRVDRWRRARACAAALLPQLRRPVRRGRRERSDPDTERHAATVP